MLGSGQHFLQQVRPQLGLHLLHQLLPQLLLHVPLTYCLNFPQLLKLSLHGPLHLLLLLLLQRLLFPLLHLYHIAMVVVQIGKERALTGKSCTELFDLQFDTFFTRKGQSECNTRGFYCWSRCCCQFVFGVAELNDFSGSS